MEKENLKNITKSLINRNFQIADIKAYLADKNYSIDEIENVLFELKKEHQESSKNRISKKQGLNGFYFILFSFILIISIYFNIYSASILFNNFLLILALANFLYGLFLVTRPLKNNLN